MYSMIYDFICPHFPSPLLPNKLSVPLPISCFLFFFNNPQCSVSAACMCTDTGPSSGAQKFQHWPHPPKGLNLQQLSTTNCSSVRGGTRKFGRLDIGCILYRKPCLLQVHECYSHAVYRRQHFLSFPHPPAFTFLSPPIL